MLLSATYTEATISPLFVRQMVAFAVALVLFFMTSKFSYHSLRRYAPFVYIAGVVALGAVAVIGTVIRGTVSRLEFFGVQLQPSEFMKVGLVTILAWLIVRAPLLTWRTILMTVCMLALPTALVVREPDLGVAALMVLVWAALMVFAGLSWKKIGVLVLVGGVVLGVSWQTLLLDYQKDRIRTFLNPAEDPLRTGYNITQSIIALGSGKVIGRGLGHGPQSQLKFLPERHTDFILASIGEELGFVGIMLVLGLYGILFWRIIRIIYATQDRFGQLLAAGTFFTLLTSFVVSAGMNMGLLPVTGIPLPLISYGGSNLVFTFVLLGLVESVRVHGAFHQPAPKEISGFI
ncbi:MAG: rod shape-determining protein RodA, partial [Acidobacteriota bacterium]